MEGKESSHDASWTWDDEGSQRLAAARSPLPIVVTAGPSHIVRYANAAFCGLWSGASERLSGLPLALPESIAEKVFGLLHRAYAAGAPLAVCGDSKSNTAATPVRYNVMAQPLLDLRGLSAGLVVTFVNVDEEKPGTKAVPALAQEDQDAIFESMNEGVCVADLKNGRVLLNAVSRKILGLYESFVKPEFLHRCSFERPDGTAVEFSRTVFGRACAGERFGDEDCVLVRPDGTRAQLLCSGSSVVDANGQVVFAINTFRDVTDLREVERTRQQYVSLVAHDLLGPISTVNMAAHILSRAPDRGDLTARIIQSARRMERMARDLLDSNLVRAGQQLPVKCDWCDMRALAKDVVDELNGPRPQVPVLYLEAGASERYRGRWDADQVRRAIWNLASNALKHGAPGSPIVLRIERQRGWVLLSVHNEGPPISADELPHLFAPYVRARRSKQGAPKGWGLGLTLVRGCAEAHGGRVRAESSAAGGTTFTLELPLGIQETVN